jgi:hypothetical protein
VDSTTVLFISSQNEINMRVPLSIALIVVGCNVMTSGFLPVPKPFMNVGLVATKSSHTSLFMIDSQCDEEECVLPDDDYDFTSTMVRQSTISTKGAAKTLRATVLTNANGDYVRLDTAMKQKTSVVVFLRHLG